MLFLPFAVIDNKFIAGISRFVIAGIRKEYVGASDIYSILLFISLAVSLVLMLLWAIRSFRRAGRAWSIGLFSSIYYFVQYFIVRMMMHHHVSSAYLAAALSVDLICVINIVLAILQYKSIGKS